MKTTCKDNIWTGVYITVMYLLDVDPKMYFHCTDLLPGVSFFINGVEKKIFLSLFAWSGAGGTYSFA